MRNYFGAIVVVILALTAAMSSQSHAQNVPLFVLTQATHTQDPIKGACVMGSAKQVKNRLQFTHPIQVYRNETDTAPMGTMEYHDVYYVASEPAKSGRVKLVYAPGFDRHPEAGQVFGWVNRKDIQVLSKDNCE